MAPNASVALSRVAARAGLDAHQEAQLARLLEALVGDPSAPTAVRAPEAAVDRHVADALTALAVPQLANARTIADIGAGAGVPGLVLAAALPTAEVRLVESQRRKCDFIAEGNDAVTARALAPQAVVLEYAAPLLRQGGVLVDWRGRRDADEEAAALRAAETLGLERTALLAAAPFAAARDHHLHVFEKAAPTPPRFPRRAGVARKRPLA